MKNFQLGLFGGNNQIFKHLLGHSWSLNCPFQHNMLLHVVIRIWSRLIAKSGWTEFLELLFWTGIMRSWLRPWCGNMPGLPKHLVQELNVGTVSTFLFFPLCCWWLIWPIQNNAKKLKNYWNPRKWVLILEYSVRAFKWEPTWQGLDGL